jgi:hypothetical protein
MKLCGGGVLVSVRFRGRERSGRCASVRRLPMSALAHFTDLSRTSPEVREVPIPAFALLPMDLDSRGIFGARILRRGYFFF